uniref:Polycystic kidney disease 1 like 2a n=1 Tax=Denticeps clupeoides TaxID=299321 RepID=A0AAY4BIJ4_9TELE
MAGVKERSCTDYQEVFDGSCFEFVALERSFLHAEAWCERAGGHLAFIQNEETQQFLEKHLHQEQNWWIGLAPASINFTLDSEDHGGPLSWLDGSDISYSNWIKTPWLGAGCGSILGNSGFQWEATENCSQELHFICQFESGRSLACVNYNATLQCGSGQVIEIVDSFYGRKNIHYCQSSSSYAASSAQEECSWVEVGDLVAGHCHGLQVCQTAADVASFGEPCPRLGSYLFVEYRCNDGQYLVVTIAAVSDNVTITVNWLLHPFQGNLTCSLNTGDGLLIDPYHPDGLKGSVAHMYKDPGVFTVEVECTTSDWHVTAQKVITIQEPLVNFSDIKCYSSNQSTNAPNCKALQDSPLTIQIEMEAGTNITYTILSGSTVLGKRSAINGTLPHNITLSAVAMQAMRPGCHMLSLLASNNVTAAELSSVVDVCFVEPISSLKALVSQCPDSDLQITVSLEHGAPVQLLFHASDGNQSFSESGNMNSDLQTFNISRKLQDFSGLDLVVTVKNSAGQIIKTSFATQHIFTWLYIVTISLYFFPQMMSFQVNPFSWNEAQPINSTVGALSLTREDGSTIPVANLTSEIEIFLPRPEASELKTTFLDLGNFSTLMINVTMPGIHLVVKLEPSEDVALHLLLGFQEYPNSTYFEAQTHLNAFLSLEERYTWVLSPRDVIVEEGVYYLLVRPIVEAGVKSTNATVYITSIAAQCMYWDEAKSNWSDYGCRVGPLTTPFVTQCLCNHLTFFGSSFFVMPNVVDVSQTAQLFSTFVNNPVVVCFVIAIFVAYFLMVVWARKKDTEDGAKLKITVLDDNDPLAEYRYLLNISTGHRRGASTSSQVTVTLMGSEGESDPHHLTDPDKPVFDRGAVDMFLLTTPFSLGDLHSIRLWHDNSGEHPAWYVNKVMVQDLETGMKWSFLCNSWLAIDMGECVLDKVFPVATEMDLKRFSNLFYMKTAKDFQDGHIWFSVLNRPPSSNFTRVQRISCCFSLFLCTMLTSIMFWGVPTDPAEQTMDLGQIEFTWQQVMIGFQSSIIMFPINLLIVTIFRHTRSRQQKQINADIKKIAQSLAKVLKSPMPIIDLQGKPTNINTLLSLVEDIIQQNYVGNQFLGKIEMFLITFIGSQEKITSSDQKLSVYHQYLYRQLQHVEKELDILGPAQFSTADSYTQAVQQVRGMKGLLEPHMSCSSVEDLGSPSAARTTKGGNGDRKCCQKGLPWWFVFVAWILVAATSGVSAFFTMLYGLKYGKERSISWLISMVVSFFESLFITQPLKVLGFAVFFSLVLKKIDQEEYEDVPIEGAVTKPGDPSLGITRRNSTCSFYQPPPPSDIERMRNNMMKEKKVFALLREILIYAGFMWMLLLVAYGQRDPNAFHLRQHIQQCFSKGIKDSMSLSEIFSWTNTTFLTNLFGQKPGFITDGNSRLVGNARLRQIRVNKDSCHVTHSMHPSIPECHAPYSWEAEDMGSYGTRWNSTSNRNTSQTISPWQYQTQHKVRASPIWGSITLYRGGGFVVDMGPERQNATRMLQYIFNNDWLDVYTRAIFLELTVYNANVNLFCIITLMFESSAVGAFQYNTQLHSVRLYQSTGGFHIFVMFSEVTFLLFVCYYMFMQGKLMKQLKWAYFKSKWNLLELAMIILSWSAMSVFIKRTLLGNRDLEFASFHDTANADAVLGYLIAFLVLLATIKLWHLLRLNPKLHLITSTLQRAWTDISGFLVVMAIMFLAYSIACNLIYGWKLYSYKTLLNAAQTIISLQLGIFNYEEVLDNNPVLGSFLIGTCIIFMTFVVVNLFISVILVAFSEEQIYHKPSEEEEIVDLMLMKVCSLFGIKIKKKGGDNHSTNKDNRLPADSTPFVMS